MVKNNRFQRLICRYKDDYLFVRVVGDGEKKIVAFHGYGQSGAVFEMPPSVKKGYTIYAFDLFFHGKSVHPRLDPLLSHDHFKRFFEDFIRQTAINKFRVIGFSMGAKYALSLVLSYPEMIEKITLIAPDGIRKNFWYAVATGSGITRKVFSYVVRHPGFIFRFSLWLERLNIIDGRVRKFTLSQMNSMEKRKKVFASWTFLRKFFVPPEKISSLIMKHNIETEIIIGRYDRIITLSDMEPLSKLIGKEKISVIKSGHSNILRNYLEKCFLGFGCLINSYWLLSYLIIRY